MLKACDDASEWYSKGSSAAVMEAAERLRPILADICAIYDKCVEKVNTAQLVHNNYRSFALLVDIQSYVNSICDKENIMVLSETKDILADFIDENNAPFIYEKVGNRYDHYMIDEFQDTSVREGRNMLPLLQEALSSNSNASVFIVGDIKQSIYRWRGGDWRLLNSVALEDLGTENTELERLKKNYRSLANVVQFNNEIISQMVHLDNSFLNGHLNSAKESGKIKAETYAELYDILLKAYSDHGQEAAIESEEKGYVEVCTYNKDVTDSPFIKAIESAIERGYKYRDILILVRRGGDAVKVANQLFAYKEQKFTSQNQSRYGEPSRFCCRSRNAKKSRPTWLNTPSNTTRIPASWHAETSCARSSLVPSRESTFR
jgi:ATP-dependent exoDNAse (exonuclease V) beta subunit